MKEQFFNKENTVDMIEWANQSPKHNKSFVYFDAGILCTEVEYISDKLAGVLHNTEYDILENTTEEQNSRVLIRIE
jgi:xanthine dehydrogenase molybdopterin-binding subunit B